MTPHPESLAEVLRAVYLARSTGVIEREDGEPLYAHDGELYLAPGHARAASVERAVSEAVGPRPAAHPPLRDVALALARELAASDGCSRFNGGSVPAELVGPLPTVLVVMELAVSGRGDDDLLSRLGGEQARFRSSGDTPALQQLPGLDPDMAQVLARLERPATTAELASCCGLARSAMLRGLARLRAVGLAAEVTPARAESAGEQLLAPRLLESFSDRIAEDLAGEPLELPPDEHRRQLADLLGRLDGLDCYALLGVDPRADDATILAAYRDLARRVHPLHARRLGLAGKEGIGKLLFERATAAYLTLSDPRRRSSYNLLAGVKIAVEVDAGKRQQEKRDLARQSYRLAQHYASDAAMDYSRAVELLLEATRLDPRAEYFLLLGKTQARNPNWYADAVESYRRAVALKPDDAGYRVAFGGVLQGVGDYPGATAQYRKALELMPDHAGAREALARLGGLTGHGGGLKAGFRKVFGRE